MIKGTLFRRGSQIVRLSIFLSFFHRKSGRSKAGSFIGDTLESAPTVASKFFYLRGCFGVLTTAPLLLSKDLFNRPLHPRSRSQTSNQVHAQYCVALLRLRTVCGTSRGVPSHALDHGCDCTVTKFRVLKWVSSACDAAPEDRGKFPLAVSTVASMQYEPAMSTGLSLCMSGTLQAS